jgi:hypothetical protein
MADVAFASGIAVMSSHEVGDRPWQASAIPTAPQTGGVLIESVCRGR